MIISPGRRFIFVHIPKTGGTSMALALEARAHKDDILIGDTPKAVKRRNRLKGLTSRGRLWKHATLADIEGVLPQSEIDSMFVFTLVRNPWDRMVSYYHWLQRQSFDHKAVSLAQSLPFDAFLRHSHTVQSLSNWPAARYVSDPSGCEKAACYLRLEHLSEDLVPVEQHLGFDLRMPHENRSERQKDYRSYYDDSLAEHLRAVCQDDIQRFGYQFE